MRIDYLTHLRAESARFAEVMARAEPGAGVVSCPDWDAADLVWHLAEVQLFWGTIVRGRLDDPDPAEEAKPARPTAYADLLDLFDEASGGLVNTLEHTADDVRVWTWSDDGSAGFVRRRMAQEALVHRLDAELVVDDVTDIDAALAADGVHEALQHLYGGHPRWASWAASGPLGVIRTSDTGDAWRFQLGGFSGLSPNTGKTYDDEPSLALVDSGSPSFTVTGTARDLEAWIWNRPTLTDVDVEGDRRDFERFHSIIAKGVD